MERREEFSSKERKRKGKKMKGTGERKKKKNRKNLKPEREHIYKKINVFVYIENVTSLFCNMKENTHMKNKTKADFSLSLSLSSCVGMYICSCIHTHNYFLVAYQKNLPQLHDLALGKKNSFS